MVTLDVVIYDFKQQTLRDALNFFDKAKKTDPNANPLEYWSFCSLSIISSAICMESFLTGHIHAKMKEKKVSKRKVKDLSGFYSKIGLIEQKWNVNFQDDLEKWKKVRKAIRIRNKIVHFNKLDLASLMTLDNAKDSLLACKYLLYRCKKGFKVKYAPWVESFIKSEED